MSLLFLENKPVSKPIWMVSGDFDMVSSRSVTHYKILTLRTRKG